MRRGAISRRELLAAMAGGAAALSGVAPGLAPALALAPLKVRDARITKLIGAATHLPAVARRIAFISHELLGSPYRGYTLIGGPRRPERFVVRDDVFDCVTFIETVLAAARAHDASEFQAQLRLIRYRDGEIAWRARNHYFADWCTNNVANKVCRPLLLPGHTTVDKRLSSEPGLSPRRVAMSALPVSALFDNRMLLATGDIVGFLSRRPGLDYFHSGFVVVDDAGNLWLRHAAQSHGRVLDQPLSRFIRDNPARAVTLLRAREPKPGPVPI